MSQTTTAAASAKNTSSFDWVVATIPAELSPTNNKPSYPDTSYCDPPDHVHLPAIVTSPPGKLLLPHTRTAQPPPMTAEDEATPRIALISRNTFVHFETASPLAKMNSAELVKSFRAFSKRLKNESKEEDPDLANWIHHCLSNRQMSVRGSLCDLIRTQLAQGTTPEENGYECIYLSPAASSLMQPAPVAEPPISQVTTNADDLSSSKGFKEGHPFGCKPCAFFWSKGCLNGDDCLFCHQWHVPKRKKPMREQKNLMIIAKEDGKIAFLRCHADEALLSNGGGSTGT